MFVADTLASHLSDIHKTEITNNKELFKKIDKDGNSKAGDF